MASRQKACQGQMRPRSRTQETGFRFSLDPEVVQIMATPEYARMRPALCALVTNDKKHDGYIYPPALDVATVVLVAFAAAAATLSAKSHALWAKTWAIVEALPQSGKTGVMQALWLAVSTPEFVAQHLCGMVNVGGALFISGTNDNELRHQTCMRLTSTKRATGLETEMRVFHNTALQQLLASWHSMDEAHRDRGEVWDIVKERCLIVIDESHHGQNADSTVDQLLRKLGISGDGSAGDNPCGHFVVSVSATPMTETRLANNKLRVHLQPGKGYIGPIELWAQGRVLESTKLSSDAEIDAFFQLCLDAYTSRGFAEEGGAYVVVRVPTYGKAAITFMQRMRASGYSYREFDAKSGGAANSNSNGGKRVKGNKGVAKGSKAINAIVGKKPDGLNFVLVKRRLAQGVTFTTRHVALMYDTASSNTDTVAQSFLGRACGYRDAEEQRTLVYCDAVRAQEYIEWAKSSFDPALTPAAARNMVVAKTHRAAAAAGGAAHDGNATAVFQSYVPVLIRKGMSEAQLAELRGIGNWAVVQRTLRESWPQARHLAEQPYAAKRPSVRVARDVNHVNAAMFEQVVSAAVTGMTRLPQLHESWGEHRYEVIIDARTGSPTRGDVVVVWRGHEVNPPDAGSVGIVTGITASEAEALRLKQRGKTVEMWAPRANVATVV